MTSAAIKTEYGRSFRTQLDHFPVWDVGTHVEIGDYGIVDGNCFFRLGDIVSDFQATPESTLAGGGAFWEFASAGTSLDDSDVKAAVAAPRMEASLRLNFSEAYSLYVRAAGSIVLSMKNPAEVGRQLANHPTWERSRFVFVSSVRTAPTPVVVVSIEQGSSVIVTGTTDILQALQAGELSSEAKLKVTGNAALKAVGAPGAIYVDLMRLRLFGGVKKAALPGGRDLTPVERLSPKIDIESGV